MRTTSQTTAFLTLSALALLGACRSAPHEPPAATAPAAVADEPGAPTQVQPAEDDSQRDVTPPLVMRLEPNAAADGSGDLVVAVRIEVPAPLGYPVRFRASLPSQAKLVSSELDAPIDGAQSGSFVRELRVHAGAPLSLEAPLVVVAEGRAQGGAVGLRAEKQLPPKPELHVAPNQGPVPPGGRPPGAARR
jgi:hypothetical protein